MRVASATKLKASERQAPAVPSCSAPNAKKFTQRAKHDSTDWQTSARRESGPTRAAREQNERRTLRAVETGASLLPENRETRCVYNNGETALASSRRFAHFSF